MGLANEQTADAGQPISLTHPLSAATGPGYGYSGSKRSHMTVDNTI